MCGKVIFYPMTGFGRRYKNNVLATLLNDLARLKNDIATQIVGNIVLIGGIFISNCGKDIKIGDVLRTIPYPTLSNTCIALTRLQLPLPMSSPAGFQAKADLSLMSFPCLSFHILHIPLLLRSNRRVGIEHHGATTAS